MKIQRERLSDLMKSEAGAFMVIRKDGITIKSFATAELAEEAAKLLAMYHYVSYEVKGPSTVETKPEAKPAPINKELQRAERELIKEYRWRQRRYSESVNGIRRHAGNCWNEESMAKNISRLEDLVEKLGGDYSACLKKAREMEDEKNAKVA